MNWNFAQSLWDLISPKAKWSEQAKPARDGRAKDRNAGRAQQPPKDNRSLTNGEVGQASRRQGVSRSRKMRKQPMQDRYDALVVEMKRTYGIRVRKWRNSSSGCAWEVKYSTGSITRLIESPYPKGPMSCAIFLHEVGHHAIGFRTYRPRCLEEFYAWKWSLETMRAYGFNVTASVQKRMDDSLRYAVAKAKRRGLRDVPAELRYLLEVTQR